MEYFTITKDHCDNFFLLLAKDGIEKNTIENLHTVCDPNQYMIDVLGIDPTHDTMPIYDRFCTEIDRRVMFRKKFMGCTYYSQPKKLLPTIEIIHKNYRPNIDELGIVFQIFKSCIDEHSAKAGNVQIKKDQHSFNNFIDNNNQRVHFLLNDGKTDRIWLYNDVDGQRSHVAFGSILFHF